MIRFGIPILPTALAVLGAGALSTPGDDTATPPPGAPVAPVTDLVRCGDAVIQVTQAGIFRSSDGTVPPQVFARPGFRVTSASMADDLLVLAGGEPGVAGRLAVLDADTGVPVASRAEGDDLVYRVAVSGRHGAMLAAIACANGEVAVRSLPDLAPALSGIGFRHTAAARAVAFSPDGRWLASVGLDGIVWRVDLDDPDDRRVLTDHTAGIESLAFSPDSRWLASGSRDAKVRLHRVEDGRLIRTYLDIGMEHEPVAGRRETRVLSLLWGRISDAGGQDILIGGTSKGAVHALSPDDDRHVLVWSGEPPAGTATVPPEPVRALLQLESGDVLAAAGPGRPQRIPAPSLVAAWGPDEIAATRRPVDVYLLGGQSNMQGIGKIADVPEDVPRAVPHAFFWNGASFERLVVGTTRTSTRAGEFGPEFGFALETATAERPAHLVKFHASGIGLHAGWNDQTWEGEAPAPNRRTFHPGDDPGDPNQGTAYRDMAAAFRASLEHLRESGVSPVVRGFAWMQGEQDSKQAASAITWAANLARLRARLEEDLGLEGPVPMVFGQVLPHVPAKPRFTHRDEIRRQMDRADGDSGREEAIPLATMVPTDGFGLLPDTVHFDAAGQLRLGRAFAEALASLQAGGR